MIQGGFARDAALSKVAELPLHFPDEVPSPTEFDLFSTDNGSMEEQRAFEIWWKKQTGRSAVVISGFEYEATLELKE
jgi:hypothetical protein